ncbi:zinc-ribbon domain-containing protein [Candidatus Pelagibacter sp. Uisw_127]|uniref:zinc-ribbon domain-containing protein n=1 Tax=Candidatus Pelagibacter sp. Uisw_127 TaxID=3230988 RepID=UPI0039EC3FBC
MIISCKNCDKNFEVASSLIPDKGRLLECNSCNYKWFFKKDIINEPVLPIKIKDPVHKIEPAIVENLSQKIDSVEIKSPETIKLLDSTNKLSSPKYKNLTKDQIERDKTNKDKDKYPGLDPSKNEKNYNFLSLILIFIISFTALIVLLDTFQTPISKIVPDIEFILYNLYETINDISLFFKDLI